MQRLITLPAALLLAFGLTAFGPRSVSAQNANEVSRQAESPDNPNSGKLMLHEGVDVPLKFAESLSSKTAADGDPVTLILDQDLKVGDVVVAKAGSQAFGEVTGAKKSRMLGKAGELNLKLSYLKVGVNKVMLRASKVGDKGGILSIFRLKRGKNVDIQEGTPLVAFVAQDTLLPPAL
jgi:hypothetical protein